MSWTADVLTALAAYLDVGDVGTWQADGAYPAATSKTIHLGDVPGTPHQLIVLTAYPVADDISLSDSVLGVQVRTRGLPNNPRSVDDLDDAVFDRLHGARGIDASSARIVSVERRSGTPLGKDGNRRHERSSNYLVTAHRPSQHRS